VIVVWLDGHHPPLVDRHFRPSWISAEQVGLVATALTPPGIEPVRGRATGLGGAPSITQRSNRFVVARCAAGV